MRNIIKYITLFVILTQSVMGQGGNNFDNPRKARYRKIDIQHFGVGMNCGVNENVQFGPKLFYGIGSYRNLLNAEVGCRYVYCISGKKVQYDAVSSQYCSLFFTGDINFIRGNAMSVYLGSELAYNCAVASSYISYRKGVVVGDNGIAANYVSVIAKIGMKRNRLDANVYLGYNLSPPMNQKYVYESAEFRYDDVYDQLHERCYVGFSLSYLIPL